MRSFKPPMNTDGHGFDRDVGTIVGSSLPRAVSKRPETEEVAHGTHGAHGRRPEFRVFRVFRGPIGIGGIRVGSVHRW